MSSEVMSRRAPARDDAPAGARPPWWRSRALKGFGYAAPTALFVAVFFVLPLLLVGDMSASDWPLLAGDRGTNFPDNYTSISDNRLFWPAVGFTLKYTGIVVVLLLGLALLMALLVQEYRPGAGTFRTIYFLPASLGLASASLLFWGFYSPSIGPLDPLLNKLGLVDGPVSWIGSPTMALFSTVALIIWKFAGFFMLILLVGLQSISTDVYEAARIDGANRWQTFVNITVPLLRPSLALVLILSRDRLAAGVRPVLHPDQGRAGQLDRHGGAADLPGGVLPPGPRQRRRDLGSRAGRAAGAQHRAVPVAAPQRGDVR